MKFYAFIGKYFLFLLLCFFVFFNLQAVDREHTLKIYSFVNYIDEEVLDNFPQWYKEQTGEEVKLILESFDMEEIVITKVAQGREDFDLVCCPEGIVNKLLVKNLLFPIEKDFGAIPNYISNLSPFIQQQLNKLSCEERKMTDYSVGYMWGTVGVLYNADMVEDKDVLSWDLLWKERYRNSILMKDVCSDIYGVVIGNYYYDDIVAGKMDATELILRKTPEDIALVEKLLKEMKPNIVGWEIDFGREIMTKGKIPLNVTYSGDAMWAINGAKETGVNLKYHIPKEVSEIWFDAWAVPCYAKNTKAANLFINYMCRPDNALKNMEYSGYVSCIATPEILEAMKDSTSDEILDLSYFFGEGAEKVPAHTIHYPDKPIMERCVLHYGAGEKSRQMIDMWSRVKG
ncbi:MAG TPA: spermidine/putrescine ABC transporter, partial [Porphyromonadaceae bacterium]|nr:spermidine/putrescine ABC transporter [Porphyromonadaceae bacterium]